MRKKFLKTLTLLCIVGLMVIASIVSVSAQKIETPTYENNLKIAVVNFQAVWGDKDANLNHRHGSAS